MSKVIDHETDWYAKCPFSQKACVTECMLMRYTAFGEPRCSIRVIADELVLFDKGRAAGGKEAD
ncbi:MAG: hypothetical protein IKO55_14630 [Kiritimatiellae bacterium]|nr:hypothetical protein [Kiritimatiellia bacterium]